MSRRHECIIFYSPPVSTASHFHFTLQQYALQCIYRLFTYSTLQQFPHIPHSYSTLQQYTCNASAFHFTLQQYALQCIHRPFTLSYSSLQEFSHIAHSNLYKGFSMTSYSSLQQDAYMGFYDAYHCWYVCLWYMYVCMYAWYIPL